MRTASETCRVIINQVKQKLHLVGYLLIQCFGQILPIIRSVRLRYLQHMLSCCGGQGDGERQRCNAAAHRLPTQHHNRIPYAVNISVSHSWWWGKYCPKHIELILQINKSLLHLVGSSVLLDLCQFWEVTRPTEATYWMATAGCHYNDSSTSHATLDATCQLTCAPRCIVNFHPASVIIINEIINTN